MQLERMTARIAPRPPWMAMDLGARLYRHWWAPLTRVWLTFTLLPFVLILWFADGDTLGWGLLLFWWLKPLWERPLLEFCARALFADVPSAATLARSWHRHSLSGLLPWLLGRRLRPSRALLLPVTQLEGQRGEAWRRRVAALGSGRVSRAGALTLVMLHIEQFLALGLLVGLAMAAPTRFEPGGVSPVLGSGEAASRISAVCWYLAMTVTEPLYVTSGFALYLNQRTWLEGWDLEIGLRRIGARRAAGAGLAAVATVLLLWGLPAPQAFAAERNGAREAAIGIVAGEDFMPMELESGIRLRNDLEPGGEGSFWAALLRWLRDHGSGEDGDDGLVDPAAIADAVRVGLWILFLGGAAWLVHRYRHWLRDLARRGSRGVPAPVSLAGLDIRRESLPDDPAAEAARLAEAGELRGALGLLYRATLSRLAERHDAGLPPGATESECLAAFRNAAAHDPAVALLARLTPVWANTAWAHRPPGPDVVLGLAGDWRRVFRVSTT